MIVYDIEIINAILPKNSEDVEEGITYCQGWHDHANMGVSVIGCYDFEEDRYRVFLKDNFREFNTLQSTVGIKAGFNSIPFDNAVLRASNIADISEHRSYDLLREIWAAAGLGPVFQYPSHAGYSLDAVAQANNVGKKSGNGALAPILWQRGQYGAVIDYCLQDVALTVELIRKVSSNGWLTCPKTGNRLKVKSPYD
jgi:DEAD/DEAH box helicase domain-containing protein